MKILQIIPNFSLAGAERMAEALILELIQQGHQVAAVSLFDDHTAITDNLEAHGVKVYYLGKRSGLDFSMFGKLYQIFRKEKPDIMHTHLYICKYAVPAAVLAGIPGRVHTVHNVADKERLSKGLQSFFYRFCRVTPVGLSPLVTESVQRLYKLPTDRVPTIYNGIQLAKTTQKTDYQARKTFRFLHVGRFAEQKNHAGLVTAFARFHRSHPDAELTLVGTGELFDPVQQQIRELGLADVIHTPGLVNNIISQYSSFDAFLLPSLYEGMPITLIEAMSSAMPIIASEVGGVPDMIRHNHSGLLCTSQPESIAAAMEQLYSDAALRQRLGQQAQVDCVKFSSQGMADAYLEVYRKVLNKNEKRRT